MTPEDQVKHMDISENSGTTKSSILIGFSIINHPFWGTPIFGNTHMDGGMLPDLLTFASCSFRLGLECLPSRRKDLEGPECLFGKSEAPVQVVFLFNVQ